MESDSPSAQQPRWEVWGTFDVANVGDLLFPLLVESESHRVDRDGPGNWRWVTPTGETAPLGLGRETSTTFNASRSKEPLGAVYGGGDLVRFEPATGDSLLSDYHGLYRYDRLITGLMKRAERVPVAWNGCGVPAPLAGAAATAIREFCKRCAYVSVRDNVSAQLLADCGFRGDIDVVPDPAFLADRVVAMRAFASARAPLAESRPRTAATEILAVQASFVGRSDEQALTDALKQLLRERPQLLIRAVPLGPCHGDIDRMRRLSKSLGDRTVVADAETIDGLVEALVTADAFIGSSLHGNLLGVRARIPSAVLVVGGRQPHKLTELASSFHRPLVKSAVDIAGVATELLDRRLPVDDALIDRTATAVDEHYDRVFAALGLEHVARGGQSAAPPRLLDDAFEEAVALRLNEFHENLAASINFGTEAVSAYQRALGHQEALEHHREKLEDQLSGTRQAADDFARALIEEQTEIESLREKDMTRSAEVASLRRENLTLCREAESLRYELVTIVADLEAYRNRLISRAVDRSPMAPIWRALRRSLRRRGP
jgi:hypothetical protein